MRHRIVLALGTAVMLAAVGLGAFVPRASAVASPAAGPYRAASPEYGMSVFLYGHAATTARDLAKVQAVNFGWQKSLFQWRDLERACKGCFDWSESDRIVRASAEANLKMIARLDFQPQWSRPDNTFNGPPANYQDYADFVRAFVDRYKTGSPNGTVQAIQVWNEVNLAREWGEAPISQQTAAEYVRFLSAAYKAAKAADPNVTVITAALSPTSWNDHTARPDDLYLRWLFEAGLKGNYDVLGANANVQCPCVDHDPNASPPAGFSPGTHSPAFYFRRVEHLREIMVAAGDADKQVWLMEFGWTTDTIHQSYSWYATTETKKAELIIEAFRFASQKWAPWIGVMTLWTLPDPNWDPNREELWWAIAEPDGTPRPAYTRLLQAQTTGELPGLSTAPIARGPGPAPPAAIVPPPAAAEPAAGERLRVLTTGVNFRKAPSTTAGPYRVLELGEVVQAIGGVQQSEGRAWRNVRDASGVEGWVAAEFLAPQ